MKSGLHPNPHLEGENPSEVTLTVAGFTELWSALSLKAADLVTDIMTLKHLKIIRNHSL